MPSPVIFAPLISGLPLSSVDQNNNWALVESSFADIGPYISSGLIPTVGTGLSVNISSGTAVIGAHLAPASFVIGGLTPSTTVHLYLNQNGTGTSNTTGTQPANSVKLGTAVTGVATVTSVNTLRSSGRQVFVRPENQVPGAVGSPGSINLASWAAAAADNVPVFGVLPAGAVPALAVPLTLTLDDANQNTVQTPLILRHSYNAGGGANGIGTALSFSAETATDGVFNTAVQFRALWTDATAATATGRLDVLVLSSNAPSTPLTIAPNSIILPQTPAATGQHGLLNIGGGGFAGGAGSFSGEAPGTLLAINAVSGYAGGFFNVQLNGVPKFWLDNLAELFHLGAPVTSANAGHVSLGPDFAHFDGSTAGKFVGSASGTYLAINAQSGYSGNLIDAQTHGVRQMLLTGAGALTVNSIANAGTYAGSGAPPHLKRAAVTFPSDADYTLLSTEYDAFWLDIQTGVITATRNVIVPVQAGMFYLVRNNNTHDVVIKTSGGTGITVAAGRARFVGSGAGTNLSSFSGSNDFSL